MSILQTNLEVARHATTIDAKSEFARKVEQACDILAVWEVQQQAFDELVAKGQKVIQESRTLLQDMDGTHALSTRGARV